MGEITCTKPQKCFPLYVFLSFSTNLRCIYFPPPESLFLIQKQIYIQKKFQNYIVFPKPLERSQERTKIQAQTAKKRPSGYGGRRSKTGTRLWSITGSEILRVLQISFPLSRYWVTQNDTGVTLMSPTKLIRGANVYAQQFHRNRRGAF